VIKGCKDDIDFGYKDQQFSATEFFADKMIQVDDQKSAHDALKIIIDQGEGSVGVEDARYQMFLALYLERTEWTCWPVPNSPNTEMYKADTLLYEVSIWLHATFYVLESNVSLVSTCIRRSLLLPVGHDPEDLAS
jgi:hypothetical protein